MRQCSEKAFIACNGQLRCKSREVAFFLPGSQCDDFNRAQEKKATNGDRIRSMIDEELSEFINALTVCDCCSYDGICSEYNNIPKCRKGVLEWLQQPTEGETK